MRLRSRARGIRRLRNMVFGVGSTTKRQEGSFWRCSKKYRVWFVEGTEISENRGLAHSSSPMLRPLRRGKGSNNYVLALYALPNGFRFVAYYQPIDYRRHMAVALNARQLAI
jgi:hypothetical protein